MELLKDEEILEKIKEDKIDRIFFEKIEAIEEAQSKLSFISKSYISALEKIDNLSDEDLESIERVFDKDIGNVEDLRGLIDELRVSIDYRDNCVKRESIDGTGIVTTFYDDVKEEYIFTATYSDRSVKGSPIQVYNMSYSFKDGVDTSPELLTEANMYIGSSCKCCVKPEVNVRFPDGEDIGHYIMVSELDTILNRLENIVEEEKTKYNKLSNLL